MPALFAELPRSLLTSLLLYCTDFTAPTLDAGAGFKPATGIGFSPKLDLATTMNAELLRNSLSFIEARISLRDSSFASANSATLAGFRATTDYGTTFMALVQGAGVEPARFVASNST